MGGPVWKRINVVSPWVVNRLNVAGYGRSRPEKSWTAPSLFQTCLSCFLPANITNKKSLNFRNFIEPFLCNFQSLETWNLWYWDRDSQKWVSRRVWRPRPSLETPSLV